MSAAAANGSAADAAKGAKPAARPGQIVGGGIVRRRGSFGLKSENIHEITQKASTPLKPAGEGPPRIVDVPWSITGLEGETAALPCRVEGTPAPKIKWMRGTATLDTGRYKTVTNGEDNNTVYLLIQKVRIADEDGYKVIVENEHGSDSVEIRLFVADPKAAMDYRAMLKRRQYEKWAREQEGLEDVDLKKVVVEQPTRPALPKKKQEYFEKPLEDVIVRVGEKEAKFECVFCNPKSKVRWFKYKTEIFNGQRIAITADKCNLSLTVLQPELSDAAKITCEANGVTTVAQLIVLEAAMKYYFTQPLPFRLTGILSREVKMECKVNDNRAPVKWYFNDKEIEKSNTAFFLEKDTMGRCTLTIKSAEKAHEGKFMAKINDEHYTVCELKLAALRHEFISPLKSVKVTEKDQAVLECEVNDNDVDVEWFHDGQKIKLGDKFTEQRDGKKRRLVIKGSAIGDSGEYKCTTKDDQTICQLIVEPANHFITPLADTTGVEKGEVTLSCETKNQVAGATWYRNGQKITPMAGTKYEGVSKNGKHSLTIKNLQLNDSDVYEIESGGIRCKCKMNVVEAEKKPIIDWKNKKFETDVGKALIVKIPYSIKNKLTDPTAVVLRNGKPVGPGDGVDIQVQPDHVLITLKSPSKKDDPGKWELQLSNTAGTASAPFEVDVKDRPEPPEGPLEISNITAASASLKWKPPKNDGGSPVTGYVVEQQKANGEWVKVGEPTKCEFQAIGLEKGSKYKFRVRAVNKIGQSEPLAGTDEITAKDPWDPPGKPRDFKPIDVDQDHVTLSWRPPESDGKAPIEKYVLERREKDQKDFAPVGEVPANAKLEWTDKNVTNGKEYFYRVKAVNKAGPGEPADLEGGAVLVKPKPAAPTLDKLALKDIKIRVGETLKYVIKIHGEPAPEALWSKDGENVVTIGRRKVTTTKTETIVEIEKVERKDSGVYQLTVRNANGEETGTAKVIVVGPPSPPEGPLEVSALTKDGCTLAWKPPKDDGGEPIEGYNIEAQDPSGNWVPVGKAKAGDTSFKVAGLKPNTDYKFRVKAVNKEGESAPLEADTATKIPAAPTMDKLALKDIKIRVGETLKFVVKISGEPPPEAAWSKDGENVVTIGRRKVTTTKTETVVEVEKVQRADSGAYQLKVKNAFGEEVGVAKVIVVGPPSPPGGPLEVAEVCKDGCKLSWKKPEDDGGEPLEGFNIEAQEAGGQWVPVGKAKPGDTSFKVSGLKNNTDYKFRVKAVNKEGESAPLEADKATKIKDPWDTPGKPRDLDVIDLDKDHVTLGWKPPETDGNAPLEKYVIFRRLKGKGEFEQVGEIAANAAKLEFTDKSVVENGEYEYQVRAVNKAGPGEPAGLKNGSVFVKAKPAAPTLDGAALKDLRIKVGETIRYEVKLSGVPIPEATWFNGANQLKMNNKRTKIFTTTETNVATLLIENAERTDSGQYSIQLQNASGTVKASANVLVVGKPDEPEGPLLATDIFKNGCMLNWKPPQDDGGEPLTGYIVEAKEQGGKWVVLGQSKPTEPSFAATGLKEKTDYLFRVKAVNKEGESEPLECDKYVKIKDPLDEPGKPGLPKIVDFTEDSLKINWTVPTNDGGAPIEKYIIEVLADVNSNNWVALQESVEPSATIPFGYTADCRFRIRAVNKVGIGEPGGSLGINYNEDEVVAADSEALMNIKEGAQYDEFGGSKVSRKQNESVTRETRQEGDATITTTKTRREMEVTMVSLVGKGSASFKEQSLKQLEKTNPDDVGTEV